MRTMNKGRGLLRTTAIALAAGAAGLWGTSTALAQEEVSIEIDDIEVVELDESSLTAKELAELRALIDAIQIDDISGVSDVSQDIEVFIADGAGGLVAPPVAPSTPSTCANGIAGTDATVSDNTYEFELPGGGKGMAHIVVQQSGGATAPAPAAGWPTASTPAQGSCTACGCSCKSKGPSSAVRTWIQGPGGTPGRVKTHTSEPQVYRRAFVMPGSGAPGPQATPDAAWIQPLMMQLVRQAAPTPGACAQGCGQQQGWSAPVQGHGGSGANIEALLRRILSGHGAGGHGQWTPGHPPVNPHIRTQRFFAQPQVYVFTMPMGAHGMQTPATPSAPHPWIQVPGTSAQGATPANPVRQPGSQIQVFGGEGLPDAVKERAMKMAHEAMKQRGMSGFQIHAEEHEEAKPQHGVDGISVNTMDIHIEDLHKQLAALRGQVLESRASVEKVNTDSLMKRLSELSQRLNELQHKINQLGASKLERVK